MGNIQEKTHNFHLRGISKKSSRALKREASRQRRSVNSLLLDVVSREAAAIEVNERKEKEAKSKNTAG